jgi:hypothetical protein
MESGQKWKSWPFIKTSGIPDIAKLPLYSCPVTGSAQKDQQSSLLEYD